jgi:hypothetical protein
MLPVIPALGRNPFEEIDAFDDLRLVVRGGRS